MRLQKFGPCCLLVSEAGSALLIDPGSYSTGAQEVTGLTAVLITHIHRAHLDADRLRVLLDRNRDAQVICDSASFTVLAESGIPARVVHAGDQLSLGLPVRVYGHEHAVIHPDLPNVPNVGYLIGDRLFYPGDALTVPDRPVPILAVPVGAPWLNVTELIDWLRVLRPRIAVPVHDGGHVLAELPYHAFERLSPSGTSVLALSAGLPVDL